jgi:hypothetical protein
MRHIESVHPKLGSKSKTRSCLRIHLIDSRSLIPWKSRDRVEVRGAATLTTATFSSPPPRHLLRHLARLDIGTSDILTLAFS